jgi:hypothetical protein
MQSSLRKAGTHTLCALERTRRRGPGSSAGTTPSFEFAACLFKKAYCSRWRSATPWSRCGLNLGRPHAGFSSAAARRLGLPFLRMSWRVT